MVTQTYATARWQQLTTHSGWVWLPPGYSVGWESMRGRERLVVCQGRQQPLQLITIWLQLMEENDTHGSVEKIPVDDLEGGRWWGHRPSTNTLVCFDELLVKLLFGVRKSYLPKRKISVTFKERTRSLAEGHDYSVVLVYRLAWLGCYQDVWTQFASYQNHCWCWSEAKCYRNL